MPAGLLAEWGEFAKLEPFGPQRDNWHAAILATILANAHRDPKRRPIEMSRFFYRDAIADQDEHDAHMLAAFDALKEPTPNGR